jgi:hypothetical protein
LISRWFPATKGNAPESTASRSLQTATTAGTLFCARIKVWTATKPAEPSSSHQLFEERPCLFEIGRVEALGEPAVDRRKQIARLGALPLIAREPGEARGGAQFPELGLSLSSDAQGIAIQFLGGLGMPLPQ